MNLVGKHIVLKKSTEDELPDFARWMNDLEVTRHLGEIHGKKITLEEEMKWFKGVESDPNELLFSIFTLDENKLIGNCAIHMNVKRDDKYSGETFLGLVIGEKNEWGKGYGTEVILLLLQHLKNYDLEKVYLNVDCVNEAAVKVYKKCGFEVLAKTPKTKGEDEYLMVCNV